MSLSRLALGSLLVLGLAACSSDSSPKSSPLTPLSATQKADVTYVMASADAAQNAAHRAGGTNMNGTLNLIDPNQQPLVTESAGTAPNPINKEEKTAQLSEWLRQSGTCTFDNTMPDGRSGDVKNGNFHFKVSGNGCPIAMSMELGYQTKETSNSISMRIRFNHEYKVLDEGYAHMNDVTAMSLKGDLGVSGNPNGASGGGNLTGKIESNRYGTVGMSVGMNFGANRNGSTMVTTVSLRFKDFTAVGRVVAASPANGPEKITYFINDQAVTEQEFKEVFGEQGLGAGNVGGNGGNSGFPNEMLAQ